MHITQAWRDLLHPGDATDFFQRVPMPPFEPNAADYSRANALWLAELSRLVYRHDIKEGMPYPQPTLDAFLAAANFNKREFFLNKATDTQAMLIESTGTPHYAVLAFRGTEQVIRDFNSDLKLGKFTLYGTKKNTHDGFKEALDSVWNDINATLNKLPANCQVFYTGHSLGAALATLAAAKRPPKALYTFGSPQVGNQAFVNSMPDIPIHRVVDDKDIVTTLPPPFVNFRHTGKEHKLTAPKNNFLLQHLFDPPKPLADHAPINYVSRI
jgi:hypothetical protein